MKASDKHPPSAEFARQARMRRTSVIGEFLFLVKKTRKWWMLPLVLLLLAFGVMMVLSSSGVGPFIYTTF